MQCNIDTKHDCVSSQITSSLLLNVVLTYLKDKCGSGISVTNDIYEVFAFMSADGIASVDETANKLQPNKRTLL